MPIVNFTPVAREGAHVIITAYGFSGCGKTYSLIKLGRGLVGPKGRLAMLDTETGRGKIYAKVGGGYDYAELTPPFTPQRYVEAIDAAEAAGIEALIIDSGSHEWEGLGGILEMADSGKSQSGNPLEGLVKWAKPKAAHKRYVHRLLNSRMHLLISLRAKEKMRQLTAKDPIPDRMRVGDIISEGYMPIQDKRFVFETTVQLYLPLAERSRLGIPIVEKCPEDLLGAFPDGAHISEDTGCKIAEWVAGGEPVDHELAALKRQLEEAAGGGTASLRKAWRGLSKAQRDRIDDAALSNLESITATADHEAEEHERAGHTSFHAIGDTEQNPAEPDRPQRHPQPPVDDPPPAAEAATREIVREQLRESVAETEPALDLLPIVDRLIEGIEGTKALPAANAFLKRNAPAIQGLDDADHARFHEAQTAHMAALEMEHKA